MKGGKIAIIVLIVFIVLFTITTVSVTGYYYWNWRPVDATLDSSGCDDPIDAESESDSIQYNCWVKVSYTADDVDYSNKKLEFTQDENVVSDDTLGNYNVIDYNVDDPTNIRKSYLNFFK